MSTQIPWIPESKPPEYYKKVLVLLKDKSVRYGYFGLKGWWIYSEHNGFIVTSNATHWKELQ